MRLPSVAASLAAGAILAVSTATAFAATGTPGAEAHGAVPHLDGGGLGLIWTVPFVGILLSIALLPLFAAPFWHKHFPKVVLFWAAALAVPLMLFQGFDVGLYEILHTLLLDYLPFIILIFTLFVVSGGIYVQGNLVGTPTTNVALLGFGTMSASLIGTTGASMLMIRPMLRANAHRTNKVHVFVFFIFLVSNVGGSLTPLGDPPLFIGYLQGVDFLWTVEHMIAPMAITSGILIVVFYVLDSMAWKKEGRPIPENLEPQALRIQGAHNILLLMMVVATVLATGPWNPPGGLTLWHLHFPLDGLVRDVALVSIAILSLRTTQQSVRVENAFAWEPIQEVAILFFAIFLTMIPALAILRAGMDGALAPLADLVTAADGSPIPAGYFWMTGVLSSFLDNAPTYLVFFNLAGGDPQQLMGPLALTLTAISAGAVFMGANSYIGNAPNFMVKSICEEQKVKMPSFFGYMAWAILFLGPIYVLLTWLMF